MSTNVLTLHFDSDPIVDSGPNNLSPTPFNGAHTTTARKMFGTASLLCNFAAFVYVGEDLIAIGAQDFYFSFYVYFDVLPNPNGTKDSWLFDMRQGPGNSYGPTMLVNQYGTILWSDGNTNYPSAVGLIGSGQWYHVELQRVSGNVQMRLNGAILRTDFNNTNFTGRAIAVGSTSYAFGLQQPSGNIDEFVFNVGVEPPPPPPMIAPGKLLSGLNNFSRLVRI